MPWFPPSMLRAIQHYRFRSMIRHAWRNVPFYRDAMRVRGLTPKDFKKPEDLKLLPLASNKEFRKDSSIFNAETVDVTSDFVMRAGNYKQIYWSRKAALQWFARISRNRAVLNRLLGSQAGYVEAYVQPFEDCNNTLNKYWRENLLFRGRTGSRYRLSINDPHEETINRLNEIRPDIVYSYGSQTEQIFKYIKNRSIPINPPRIWVYGSDMMSPGTRRHIEEEYGCLVYSTYNMNEMGALSFECEKRDGFHLNTDSCHVRVVDAEGNDVPDGESGEVVISNLVNKATVILNYRTGDEGTLSPEPCECGRNLPLLKDMKGRVCDTIYRGNGDTISYAALAPPVGSILARVRDFQVIQENPGHVCWTLVPFADTAREKVASELADVTRRVFPPPDRVEVRWIDKVELTPGHKKKFVIQRFR